MDKGVIVADKTYQPGEVICTMDAFVSVLCRPMKDEFCDCCHQKSSKLKPCPDCSLVKYCSKSCQKKDLPDHSMECKHLKNLPQNSNEDYIRLLGKIIFKLKGKDWKSFTQTICGKEVSFDDIIPTFRNDMNVPENRLFHKEMKYLLKMYIGEANMPSDEELTKIITKVTVYRTYADEPFSICFFFGSSVLDKECVPNSSFGVAALKRVMKVWANRSIEQGAERISVSLKEMLSFGTTYEKKECKCSQCSLPYGESLLTKIVDENRAYSIIQCIEDLLERIKNSMSGKSVGVPIQYIDALLFRQKGILGEKFCEKFKKEKKQIHILILNAGVFGLPHSLTEDGFDTTFQVNHLGHFYLVKLLTPILIQSAPCRIVVLSSESHRYSFITKEKISEEYLSPKSSQGFISITAYNDSKLCNVLFSNELNRRLSKHNVFSNAVHPGNIVSSNLSRNWWVYRLLFAFVRPFTKSLAQAASTSVYCAAAHELEGVGGMYFNNCCRCKPSAVSDDEELAKLLWDISENMIARAMEGKSDVNENFE